MQTHIIINGRVENSILATIAEAQKAFPNALCVDAALGGQIGDSFDEATGVFTAPPAAPSTVPRSVTRRQARQALLLAGLLDAVQPAIDAIPDMVQRGLAQIEWDDSQEFERNRPLVASIGMALGLNSAALDDLFITASRL